MASRVLVVEDDLTVAEVVIAYLRQDGHLVQHLSDGRQALEAALVAPPDLIVLDVMLPGLDGIEMCRQIRAAEPPLRDVPVVMLTALESERDRVLGLEIGADDYLTKPFSPRELVLRVASVLRRVTRLDEGPGSLESLHPTGAPATTSGGHSHGKEVSDGDLRIDLVAHRATRHDRDLALTAREFDLLAFLLAHPGAAFTRAELLSQVWGWNFGDQSTVTVHVRRLREKVEPDPAAPTRLVTVWGVGYRWDAAVTTANDTAVTTANDTAVVTADETAVTTANDAAVMTANDSAPAAGSEPVTAPDPTADYDLKTDG